MEKDNFAYAHNDTSVPERKSRTQAVNVYDFPPHINALRESAFARKIPVASSETLAFLCISAGMAKAKNILEIGTAIGVSGISLLNVCLQAHLTTIEINCAFAQEADKNFTDAGVADRVTLITGDAAEVLPRLDGQFDFIFLDGPKVQYVKYFPVLKGLLCSGGTLFADDVLLNGWVNGESPVPAKRKMLVNHIREYLTAVQTDSDFLTTVVDVGDGVALSIKR